MGHLQGAAGIARCASGRTPYSGTRFTLLSYQAAKTRSIGSAAGKCSNQTDLHLTFTDPVRPSDLPQRPSSTPVPLSTDRMAALRVRIGRFLRCGPTS
jgi:hypothetical protein